MAPYVPPEENVQRKNGTLLAKYRSVTVSVHLFLLFEGRSDVSVAHFLLLLLLILLFSATRRGKGASKIMALVLFFSQYAAKDAYFSGIPTAVSERQTRVAPSIALP